jgi:hypothetical protein
MIKAGNHPESAKGGKIFPDQNTRPRHQLQPLGTRETRGERQDDREKEK